MEKNQDLQKTNFINSKNKKNNIESFKSYDDMSYAYNHSNMNNNNNNNNNLIITKFKNEQTNYKKNKTPDFDYSNKDDIVIINNKNENDIQNNEEKDKDVIFEEKKMKKKN